MVDDAATYQQEYLDFVRQNDHLVTRTAFNNYRLGYHQIIYGKPLPNISFKEMVLTHFPYIVAIKGGSEGQQAMERAYKDEARVGLMAILFREFPDQGDELWLCFEDLNYATLVKLRDG